MLIHRHHNIKKIYKTNKRVHKYFHKMLKSECERHAVMFSQFWQGLDWALSSVLRPRQHSIEHMGDGFLQVKRPNQQYQSTEGTYSTQTNQTYNNKTWTQNTASPLVYNNMGWLGDSSHRGQSCQAWMAVRLPPKILAKSVQEIRTCCLWFPSHAALDHYSAHERRPTASDSADAAPQYSCNTVTPITTSSTSLETLPVVRILHKQKQHFSVSLVTHKRRQNLETITNSPLYIYYSRHILSMTH